jgi:two-component system, chemotaxis family, chemotaxis protein CheY
MEIKIVVVDDSKIARAQVAGILKGAGYQVVEAVDGRDGIQRVSENKDAAMIVCDVNMPVMNGLEMLRCVKTGESKSIPIVMLTTEAQPELIQRAKEHGALGWLVKPVKSDLLLAAVKKITGHAPVYRQP